MSAEELSQSLQAELDEQPSAWTRRMQRRKNRNGAKQAQQETEKTEEPLKRKELSGSTPGLDSGEPPALFEKRARPGALRESRDENEVTEAKVEEKPAKKEPPKDDIVNEDEDADEAASEMNALRRALKALRERRVELDTALSNNTQLEDENEAVNEQLEDVRAELESERNGKQRALDDLAAERERAGKAERIAAEQAAAAKAAAAETSSKVSSLQQEVESLQRQLGAAREELKSREKNGSAKGDQALRLELETVRSELDFQKTKREELAAGGKDLQAHMKTLLEGNKFLQQKLDEAKASKTAAEASSLDSVKVHKTQLAAARKELEEARAAKKTHSEAATGKLEELRRLKAACAEARTAFESDGGSWTACPGLERLWLALDLAGLFETSAAASSPGGQGRTDGERPPPTESAEGLRPETGEAAERPHKHRRKEKGEKTPSKRDGETPRKERKEKTKDRKESG